MTMIPQYVFFGLVFAVLTMLDDGIELAIGAHAANNAFLSVFVTHKDSALQTPAMYEQMEIYPWHGFRRDLVAMSLVFIINYGCCLQVEGCAKLYARIYVPKDRTGGCQMP
ncbi:MAG: hypothetical protein MZV63_10465 [Marinilabiliales bacterium]|nr:hypothetical protein [Marinilabiliales bacterium]